MTWLNRRQRDGGIDRVPLPAGVPGQLWLCGKQAIGPDHDALLAEVGVQRRLVHDLAERLR